MRIGIWGIVVIVQCLVNDISGEVNNIVKSKILFSNQDLVEKNTEIVHKTDKTILTRTEIFEFLAEQVTPEDGPKLELLLELVGPKELRHIDTLIYLMGYYKTAAQLLLQAIFEILEEDEREFIALMKNFV